MDGGLDRRTFLGWLSGAAAAVALEGPALARPGKGEAVERATRAGTSGMDRPAELVGGRVDLPPWPYGDASTSKDAMLMFRGNPAHTHYGVGAGPRKAPKVVWRHRMRDFPSLYYGKPFVWRGTGWTGQAMVHAGHVWVGSQGRGLYCFEAATGAVRWRFDAPRQFKGSGCLWNNRLYIGNVDNWLRCIDAEDGRVLWRLDSGADLDSSPVVVGGRLYIGGENGSVRCIEPMQGEVLWRTSVGGRAKGPTPGSYGCETSPAVVDDEVYCATYEGRLWSLSARDGSKRWVAQTGDDTDASPVVSGSRVLVASEDKHPYVMAFSRATGELVWRHRGEGGYWGTPAVWRKRVFACSAGGALDCLDEETGKVLWSRVVPGGTWSSPAPVGEVLVLGDMTGQLHGIEALTGQSLWVVPLGGRMHSTPVVVNGRIYVGTTDGWFYALAA
jgi:outer membrane protein assembly factor BamB